MAYAYPFTAHADSAGSTASLGRTPSVRDTTRKSSDGALDVIKEFKSKIDEDGMYLDFFQERIRIEEGYVSSLARLYDKSVAVDSLHDNIRGPRSTTRKAWVEVRDYTSLEIQTRRAMVEALREVVIPELLQLKEEQNRIRLGLKDNIKLANEMYDEHARSQLPKLKRTYYQKCQALEDHKRQEHAVAMQARLLATPSPTSPASTPLHEHPNAITVPPPHTGLSPPMATPALPPMSNPAMIALPTTPSEMPVSGSIFSAPSAPSHDRAPSITFSPGTNTNTGGKASGRGRAGSGSGSGEKKDPKEVFNDIAQQSKKGFSAIMQKLGGDKDREKEKEREEGGFVVVGRDSEGGDGAHKKGSTGRAHAGSLSGKGGEMGAMKSARLKREADEADKAYRTGVFHLESLRLRREKVQSSALTNLETFNDELNIKLRSALEGYIDTVHSTAITAAQMSEVGRTTVDAINLDYDTTVFRSKIRAAPTGQTAPVPYDNYYVGPCKSLIFGVSLTDYDFARGEGGDHGRPPTIVEKCIAAVDERGLELEGIYRISGRKAGVQKLVQDIELDEELFTFDEKSDVFSITNVLKQYLRELPDPVFPLPQPERVKYTENRESHISSNFSALRAKLRRLPPIHQTTFRAIIEHLGRVNSRSTANKMDAKNLAVVFNSVIFGLDQLPSDGNVLTMHQEKDTVLEDLITYSDLLFSAEEPVAPALPPGSALSRSGVMSYHAIDDGPQPGSSRTRIRIVNPDETEPAASSTEDGVDAAAADTTAKVPAASALLAAEGPSAAPPVAHTPDDDLDLLFDPALVPPSLKNLGSEYHARPLASTDLMRGHFGLLSTLTSSPAIAPSLYASLYAFLKSCPGTYYVLVIVDVSTDQLVAAGTLLVERKHIHAAGIAGHIEDIVVAPETRGKGLGQKLVTGLRELGTGVGCYKTILDCKNEKIPFYEKCGFKVRGTQMAYYTATTDASPMVAPSVPPPNLSASSSKQSSHLALPSLRTAPPPLPPRRPTDPSSDETHGRQPNADEVDLGSERSQSPTKTFESASSVSGITYTFPSGARAQVALGAPGQVHPAESESASASATKSAGVAGPADSIVAPVVPVASTTAGEVLEPTQQPTGVAKQESPTQQEIPIPAWADEGLGNSVISTPVVSTTTSPTSLTSGGGSRGSGERPRTPLPPGAAPPMMDAEPERIKSPE